MLCFAPPSVVVYIEAFGIPIRPSEKRAKRGAPRILSIENVEKMCHSRYATSSASIRSDCERMREDIEAHSLLREIKQRPQRTLEKSWAYIQIHVGRDDFPIYKYKLMLFRLDYGNHSMRTRERARGELKEEPSLRVVNARWEAWNFSTVTLLFPSSSSSSSYYNSNFIFKFSFLFYVFFFILLLCTWESVE